MTARDVAAFAAATRWQDLPDSVHSGTETAFNDTLGCLLAGTRSVSFAAAYRAIAADGPACASMRAFAFATAAAAMDFDDGHYEGGGIHPGSTVLSALLAVSSGGETREDMLTALVVGYEVAIRAGFLLMPRTSGAPYRTSGAASVLGAAAAVARYRGGGEDTIWRAIRIAAAHGPIATLQLPMVKESIGWAAASAVVAAALAQAGFGQGAVEAPPILGIPATPFDTAEATWPFAQGLGTAWLSLDTYIKPYPCCRAIHAALHAVETILAQEGWIGATVAHVAVEVMPGLETLAYLPPASADHAQFSFPFAIGCLLATGAVKPENFLPAGLADPAILAAGRRVVLIPSPEIKPLAADRSYPAAVTVHAAGRARRLRIDDAPGSVRLALDRDPIARKFLANAALAGLSAPEARRLAAQTPAAIAAALNAFLPFPQQEHTS